MNITREQFFGLFEDGGWFRFPRAFLFTYKLEVVDAVLLAFLMNETWLKWKDLESGEWLPISRSDIQQYLNIEKNQQIAALGRLEKWGFLEIKCRSKIHPTRRFVRINALMIVRCMDEAPWRVLRRDSKVPSQDPMVPPQDSKVPTQDPPTREKKTLDREIDRDTKDKAPRASALTGEVSFEEQATNKLSQIIQREFDIKKDTKSWPRVFANMQKYNQIPTSRIRAAIIGYGRIVGEPIFHCPIIEDAQNFRKKFGALEAAIKRAELTPKEKPKVELHPDAEAALARLDKSNFEWPHSGRRQLKELLNATVIGFNKMRERVKELRGRWRKDDSLYLISFDDKLNQIFGDPDDFAMAWAKHVSAIIQAWSDWRGNISYFHFSPSHVDFRKYILECNPPDVHLHIDSYLEDLTSK